MKRNHHHVNLNLHHIRVSLLLLVILVITSCTAKTPAISPTATSLPPTPVSTIKTAAKTSTARPTATPTPAPLGSEENPITIGFILSPEQYSAEEAAEEIAILVGQQSDLVLEALIYPDFASLMSAITNGEVDLFWLEPLEYIYLNWEGVAQVLLLPNHLGVYAYGVQFMANTESGFTSYFDPETNQSVGDPLSALQQFAGTRPCFTTPESLPGYYVPLGLLTDASTPVLDPVFTYDYNAVIRALYIQGICDFGVSYAIVGDPLTASDLVQNFPDIQDQVKVIWRSEGIIPNTNLSISPAIPEFLRHRLQEAFLDLQYKPEGLSLITTALNYDVEALKTIDDAFYNTLRVAILVIELDLESIIYPQNNP